MPVSGLFQAFRQFRYQACLIAIDFIDMFTTNYRLSTQPAGLSARLYFI
jgi:hypothetical protein